MISYRNTNKTTDLKTIRRTPPPKKITTTADKVK